MTRRILRVTALSEDSWWLLEYICDGYFGKIGYFRKTPHGFVDEWGGEYSSFLSCCSEMFGNWLLARGYVQWIFAGSVLLEDYIKKE